MRQRRGVDLERRQAHATAGQLVVEREAGRRRRAAEDELAAGDLAAAGRRAGRASPRDRPGPAGPASPATRRRPRRACLRGTARGDGSSARRRLRRRAGSRRGRRRAAPRGSRPARRGRAAARSSGRHGPAGPNRRSRPGPAMRGGRAASTKPEASSACGPRRIQNSANQARWPSSQAIGFRPARCGTRPVVAVEGVAQRRRPAVAQRRGERVAGEATRVSGTIASAACHHASMAAPTVPGPRVCIVSPAAAAANNGNWHTAARWQRFLAPVGDGAHPGPGRRPGRGRPADRPACAPLGRCRRSAGATARPAAPLALVLTGTDLYRDLDHDPRARHSLECASRVVVLQEEALARLDAATRAKAVVIVQSAQRGARRRARRTIPSSSPSATCAPRRIPRR